MSDAPGRLSARAVKILRLIADGRTYNRIVGNNPGFAFEDIFNAAAEALRLAEERAGVVPQAVVPRDEPLAATTSAAESAPSRPTYQDRMTEIKKAAPRAYEPWTQEEEERLKNLHSHGLTPRQIAGQLQRQPSAIRSRLVRLGLLDN